MKINSHAAMFSYWGPINNYDWGRGVEIGGEQN